MTRSRRAVALAAVAASGLVLAACGSSGSSNLVAVPVVQGQGVDQAAIALCNAGLRVRDSVYEPGMRVSAPPKYVAEPALRGVVQPITVTGTNPAGGARVLPGSAVSMTFAGGPKYVVVGVPTKHCIIG
jgi:hypothetical protein